MMTKNKYFRFGGDVLTEKLQQKFNLSKKKTYCLEKNSEFPVKLAARQIPMDFVKIFQISYFSNTH